MKMAKHIGDCMLEFQIRFTHLVSATHGLACLVISASCDSSYYPFLSLHNQIKYFCKYFCKEKNVSCQIKF